MPIYEYRCTSCGHELDALQKVSEEPLKVCPKCHESTLVKRISAAGFRLKGGGWYETDFKSGKKRNVAGESGSSGSDSGAAATSGESGAKKSGDSGSAGSSGSSGGGSASSDSG